MNSDDSARSSKPSSSSRFTNASREIDDRPEVQRLFANLKALLPKLESLLKKCSGHWGYEDPIYRFYYHQSFKVYGIQDTTTEIVAALQALLPESKLNDWFMKIVSDGTGRTFENEHNKRWLEVTRPMMEAFFQARFFLEMAVQYGKELQNPPNLLPSGWGAFLYSDDLR